jgi:hypothetical protein
MPLYRDSIAKFRVSYQAFDLCHAFIDTLKFQEVFAR